jgi:hypothetical protein
VPRTDCAERGVLRIAVPWVREGSRFTLLFERAALMLVPETPVLAAARIIEITDHRLWRIVLCRRLDLSKLAAVGLDETAAKRGQNYVTVFIDLDRQTKPVGDRFALKRESNQRSDWSVAAKSSRRLGGNAPPTLISLAPALTSCDIVI